MGSVPIIPEHGAVDIEHDIKVLEGLAKNLRARRFANGTLSLDSLRLQFKLDDNGLPVDCGQYERTDANDLIQEVLVSKYGFKASNTHQIFAVHVVNQHRSCSAHCRSSSGASPSPSTR